MRQNNSVQIPNQQVGGDGRISIPFAGEMRVAGKTADEVSKMIAARLAKRAIEPQVVVSIVERKGNEISVQGDVNQPTRIFMDPGGLKLLSALARAGGTKGRPHESLVTIQRHGEVQRATLSEVINHPEQNINLLPGDSVSVVFQPKVYMVFGASNNTAISTTSRRFPFETENVTLAEGVAQAGGLDQNRAEPKDVFLLRRELRKTLERLGLDTTRLPEESIPVVYAIDLSGSEGYFVMDSVRLHHMDMVLLSDSPTADFSKLLGVANSAGQLGVAVKAMAQ